MLAKQDDLDPVRDKIVNLVHRHQTTLAAVSKAVGRNHAYLHQFINRKTPRRLPEDVRYAIADFFGIDQRILAEPGLNRKASANGPVRDPQATGAVGRLTSFAARLSVARAESAFETPSAFARAAGIDRHRYADLEDGEDGPTLKELDSISQVSGKGLNWLVRGEASDGDTGGQAVDRAMLPGSASDGQIRIGRRRPREKD